MSSDEGGRVEAGDDGTAPTGEARPVMPDPHAIEAARERIRAAERVTVLTGAGVSAESGVPVFRGEAGLWRSHRPEELATPGAFRRDPRLVWEWYAYRRRLVAACSPNPAHRALARFQRSRAGVIVVTQNVDGLHERALREEEGEAEMEGLPLPLELHGSLFRVRCTSCGRRAPHRDPVDATSEAALPHCTTCRGLLRPDVVWFGESLDGAVLERAFQAAAEAGVCLVVGTSAVVQPAASLPLATLEAGGMVVEVNPDATPLSPRAAIRLPAAAGEILPALLHPPAGEPSPGRRTASDDDGNTATS